MSSIWCGYYIRTEGDDFMREKFIELLKWLEIMQRSNLKDRKKEQILCVDKTTIYAES